MFFIAAAVSVFSGAAFFPTLAFTALAILFVVAIDGVVAGTARLLPEKFAHHEKKIYQVSAKEKKFYEKLKIRKWKDRVPEIGHLTGFRKNKIADPKSVEYLDRFLMEACYGQIGHFFSCIFGCAIFAFSFLTPLWWVICIPVTLINALMNLPSLIILRYNSYKLRILRAANLKNAKKAAREQKAETQVKNQGEEKAEEK
jgi:hypothetical protein